MTDELAERSEELAREVLFPLVLGGTVKLRRPFGARLAARLAEGRQVVDLDLRTRIDVARVRRARLLAPIDTLEPVGGTSFALLAALHDLLQATNHELGGPLTRGRYLRLLANVTVVCEATPAPHDIASTLARHATFARVLELVRTDSTVSWWTGSARFRGQEAPKRLLAWPGIRRVRVDAKRVPLGDMSRGVSGLRDSDFHDALALWLGRSPLTDLATVTRRAPAFAWSASTLALVGTAPGRSLAFRAIARLPGELATVALAGAANEVPPSFGEARRLAEAFASEVAASHKLAAVSGASS